MSLAHLLHGAKDDVVEETVRAMNWKCFNFTKKFHWSAIKELSAQFGYKLLTEIP